MVILPCSTNTLAKVAHGVADTLITRAAHCHLKERRPLVLAVRESPWALMDFNNAAAVTAAGGVVMPLSPPFYQTIGRDPRTVTMDDLMGLFVDRVLAVLGQSSPTRWESGR
jgi:4-hydroxy-3-polyprenylbenzoate decarboxylase